MAGGGRGREVPHEGRVACAAMAYVVMAYAVMACVVTAYVVLADVVMPFVVLAYVVMAHVVMAYVFMASIAMAYVVMAYVALMFLFSDEGRVGGDRSDGRVEIPDAWGAVVKKNEIKKWGAAGPELRPPRH